MPPTQTPMDWTRIRNIELGERGYIVYADEARANAWFARAAYLCSAEAWRLAGDRGRIALIHEAWEALSFGYLSCDLSPWCCPVYRQEQVRGYGNQRTGRQGGERDIFGMLDRHWLNLATCTSMHEGDLNVNPLPTFATRQCDRYRLDLRNPRGAGDKIWVVQQCALAQNGELSTWLLDGPTDLRGSDEWFPLEHRTGEGCQAGWDAKCAAWRHIPTGFGAQVTILPPMTDGGVYSFVQAVARSCAERGARRVIDDGVKNAFLLNLQTAAAYNLAGSAELIDAASRQGLDLTHFNGNGPRPAEWDAAMPMLYATAGAVGAVATAAGQGWLAAVLGIIVGAIDLFTNLIGVSSLIIPDMFGQLQPVFLRWWISGRPGADTAANRPTQIVPDPPGFVPRRLVSSILGGGAFIPPMFAETRALDLGAFLPEAIPGTTGSPTPVYEILPGRDPASAPGGIVELTPFEQQNQPPNAAPWSTGEKVAAFAAGASGVGGAVALAVKFAPSFGGGGRKKKRRG